MDSSSLLGPPRGITMSERVPQSPWTLSECLTLVGPLRIFMSPGRPGSPFLFSYPSSPCFRASSVLEAGTEKQLSFLPENGLIFLERGERVVQPDRFTGE